MKIQANGRLRAETIVRREEALTKPTRMQTERTVAAPKRLAVLPEMQPRLALTPRAALPKMQPGLAPKPKTPVRPTPLTKMAAPTKTSEVTTPKETAKSRVDQLLSDPSINNKVDDASYTDPNSIALEDSETRALLKAIRRSPKSDQIDIINELQSRGVRGGHVVLLGGSKPLLESRKQKLMALIEESPTHS